MKHCWTTRPSHSCTFPPTGILSLQCPLRNIHRPLLPPPLSARAASPSRSLIRFDFAAASPVRLTPKFSAHLTAKSPRAPPLSSSCMSHFTPALQPHLLSSARTALRRERARRHRWDPVITRCTRRAGAPCLPTARPPLMPQLPASRPPSLGPEADAAAASLALRSLLMGSKYPRAALRVDRARASCLVRFSLRTTSARLARYYLDQYPPPRPPRALSHSRSSLWLSVHTHSRRSLGARCKDKGRPTTFLLERCRAPLTPRSPPGSSPSSSRAARRARWKQCVSLLFRLSRYSTRQLSCPPPSPLVTEFFYLLPLPLRRVRANSYAASRWTRSRSACNSPSQGAHQGCVPFSPSFPFTTRY